MKKLDVKDYKILYALSKNARISISQLAKAVALSREVTNYRLTRLIKNGVIVDFITQIDEQKLGYGRHLIYLAFQNVDEFKEKELLQYLVDHDFVSWTTTSTGKWSVIFDFLAKDLQEVHQFLESLKSRYGNYIGDYIIASQISFAHFDGKYYQIETRIKTKKKEKIIEHNIDTLDLEILSLLSNNARIDYVTLSKKLSKSPNAIKNRIKVLEKAHIITGYSIQPNKKLLGYEQYYVQLDFVNQTKEQEQNILAYVKEHPNMNAYYRPLGHWSIEIAVFVKNSGELRRVILDLRNHFGGFIKIHDTMLFYEEPKSNYLPKGVFCQ